MYVIEIALYIFFGFFFRKNLKKWYLNIIFWKKKLLRVLKWDDFRKKKFGKRLKK